MIKNKSQIKKILELVRNIEGWLSPQEGLFLFKLASKLSDNATLVEIGSWKGKSTIWLGSAALKLKNVKVYAIDPHVGSIEKPKEYKKINNYSTFLANIQKAGLKNTVIPIKKTSSLASRDFNKTIDILFIDGAHDYKYVVKDFLNWHPKIKIGGWIIFHDATVLSGPWKVARNKVLFSSKYTNTGMLGSMVFGQYLPVTGFNKKTTRLISNFFSYLYIMIYVRIRRVPIPYVFRKTAKKYNFSKARKKITSNQ